MKRDKLSEQEAFSTEEQLRAANQQLQADEQQLRAANQQLQALERQLRAANQQLQADEQQLRAANQQLGASEKVLRDKDDQLSMALDVGRAGVWRCNLRTEEMFIGERFYEMLGYDADDLPTDVKDFLLIHHPEDWEEQVAMGQAHIRGETKVYQSEHRLLAKDGRWHWFFTRGKIVSWDDEENPEWFIGIAMDVTVRKLAEDERERLLKSIATKNEELQSIVYVSSHDLKTPLVNIKGFSEILVEHCADIRELVKKADFDEDSRKKILSVLDEDIGCDLEYITTSAERMRKLIDGLLKVSRIGTTKIEVQTINMKEVISEILGTVKYRADEIGAEIIVEELEDCKGDKHQITQLFTNLIDNALKYRSEKRKCTIHITGQIKDDRNVYSVEDNGMGIPATYHRKIFGIYNRLHPKGPAEGEGLGLTIVQRILDRHNGHIWIESEYGNGSKFFVSLPKSLRDSS